MAHRERGGRDIFTHHGNRALDQIRRCDVLVCRNDQGASAILYHRAAELDCLLEVDGPAAAKLEGIAISNQRGGAPERQGGGSIDARIGAQLDASVPAIFTAYGTKGAD